MKFNPLGRTGMLVSEICLGTMTWGSQNSEAEAFEQMDYAADQGVNFIDTAELYPTTPATAENQGSTEQYIGNWMKARGNRDKIILATKASGPGRSHIRGGVPLDGNEIRKALDFSLGRLKTDYIDLYQIHGTDPVTPVEETVRAMEDLVSQGHVRYWGISNWAAWRIARALGIADKHGWNRPVTLQAYYTIAGRDLEREIVPLLDEEKLGLMVWSPLAGGFLSGKYSRDGGGPNDARRVTFDFPPLNKDRAFDCIDVMRQIAEARGVSVARIALAYVLNKQFVMSVIIGAKTPEQLDDNLAAIDITFTPEEMARLDDVSKLPSEYPGWMFERQAEGARGRLKPSNG